MAGSILASPAIAQPAIGGQPYDITTLTPTMMHHGAITAPVPGADVTTTLWGLLFALLDTTPPTLVFALASR